MSTARASTEPSRRRVKAPETLYEKELRRRHPGMSKKILDAWSEGR